jgi:hypothetical protein
LLVGSTGPTLTLIAETAPDPVAPYRLQVMLPPSPISVLLPTTVVPIVVVELGGIVVVVVELGGVVVVVVELGGIVVVVVELGGVVVVVELVVVEVGVELPTVA